MVLIKNISGGQTFREGEQFEVFQSQFFRSTKSHIQSGKWYFEGTLHKGNDGILFGYITNNGGMYFYPYYNENQPTLYLTGMVSPNDESVMITLPFSVQKPYTVGLGVDINKKSFLLFITILHILPSSINYFK